MWYKYSHPAPPIQNQHRPRSYLIHPHYKHHLQIRLRTPLIYTNRSRNCNPFGYHNERTCSHARAAPPILRSHRNCHRAELAASGHCLSPHRGSVPALFLAASATCIFIGSLFLFFCLPLGRLINEVHEVHKQLKFNPMVWVMDLLVRHNFPPLRWPRSSRGWTLACIFLAVYFYITAIFAFFWATGNTKAEHALTRWLEKILHTLF